MFLEKIWTIEFASENPHFVSRLHLKIFGAQKKDPKVLFDTCLIF